LLQAMIAAEHAIAADAASTRWDVIATHYDRLEALTGSPVVRLNRAVAVAERDGPAAGLALLEGLDADLPRSHRLAGVRAELLARAGDPAAARRWFDEAVDRCGNEVERQYLRARRDEVGLTSS
jgi:RNA polymerase sigma-70 factor (ECF subfamily)